MAAAPRAAGPFSAAPPSAATATSAAAASGLPAQQCKSSREPAIGPAFISRPTPNSLSWAIFSFLLASRVVDMSKKPTDEPAVGKSLVDLLDD